MAWHVVMGEDGVVTLPVDPIDTRGRTPDTDEPGRDGLPLA